MKKNHKNKQKNELKQQADTLRPTNDSMIVSDVLGSYTGTPFSNGADDPYEKPIQDADDL